MRKEDAQIFTALKGMLQAAPRVLLSSEKDKGSMRNKAERDQIKYNRINKFAQKCHERFVENSIVETYYKKVAKLQIVSILPNIISVATAGFFIYFLLTGYKFSFALMLGSLFFTVLIAMEFGKRDLGATIAENYLIDDKIKPIPIIGLLAIIIFSMFLSYSGGNKLVVATAPPPIKITNSEIDSINTEIAAIDEVISSLKKTTWKGRVTRTATKGINDAQKMKSSLLTRRMALEEKDDQIYDSTLSTHNHKNQNFGMILGIIAAFADLVLFFVIWQIERMQFEIADVLNSDLSKEKYNFLRNPPPSPNRYSPAYNNEVKQPIGFNLKGNNSSITDHKGTSQPTQNPVQTNATSDNITVRNVILVHGKPFVYHNGKKRDEEWCKNMLRTYQHRLNNSIGKEETVKKNIALFQSYLVEIEEAKKLQAN